MKKYKYTRNNRLRRARELRGWTQREVANHIYLADARTLRRWENGEAFPSLRYRAKLCEIFQQDPEELGLILEPQSQEITRSEPYAEYGFLQEETLPDTSVLSQGTHLFSIPDPSSRSQYFREMDMLHINYSRKDSYSAQIQGGTDIQASLAVAVVIGTIVGVSCALAQMALKRVLRRTPEAQ